MAVTGISVGKTGLEHKLDKSIIGKVGFQRYEVNAFGKRIKQIQIDKGKAGIDYRTTIDLEVQKFTTGLLEDKAAAVCVMDIYNGDIVSMVSSPNYDPNAFVHGVKKDYWKELIGNDLKPLNNKVISGLYPPGSTLKTIVALSALENDVWNPKRYLNCNGVTELYGEKFHCWKKKGHGYVNLRSAIKESCDVYFYEVARKLGVDRLSATAKKFGLGERVLEEFIEEKKGVVPNTTWKKNVMGKNWYLGETLHSGIGQGYWQTTPLQLCLVTAQIANGGYKIKPRIISGEDSFEGLQEFIKDKELFKNNPGILDNLITKLKYKTLFRNPENINFVKDALFGATNEPRGTSYRSRLTNKEFMFAGKTGTSQVRKFTELQRELEVKNEDLPYEQRDHALFVAFAPYHDPRYALSIIIEHGGSGSSSAAPIAKKIIKRLMERHPLREIQQIKGENI